MTNDNISPNNDLGGSNPTDSFNEPQNQEVVSVLLPQIGSTFKLKKTSLLGNIKVYTENATILNNLKTFLVSLMPVLISVTRILAAKLCRQQPNDYLVERLKMPNKRKSKRNFKVLPNKSKKHSYLERVETKADMMKQYYKAEILLSQIIQISNEKYKILLVNNEEDDITEIIITNNKSDVDKSPRRFVTRPKSLESIFL